MKAVVFLPGIMGSELLDVQGERIWPPSVGSVISGFKDIDALLDPDLRPTKPIEKVGFFSVYETLLEDIKRCGYPIGGDGNRRFIPFEYDWRRSNSVTAGHLAKFLDGLKGVDELILIGHSMGGLVLRYLLESEKYNDKDWFSSITKLVTLGTPQLGAASALAQIAGMESKLGVSPEDIVKLVSTSPYSSAYELVPVAGSALTVSLPIRGELPRSMDSFSLDISSHFAFNKNNIALARQFRKGIDFVRKPEHIEYFYVVGSAHKTHYRSDWDGGAIQRRVKKESGDGTVPISCSIDARVPHMFSQKKHATIFEDREVRKALYRFLDAPSGIKPHAADQNVVVGDEQAFGLSVDKETYVPGELIEVIVSYTVAKTDPDEIFQLVKRSEETDDFSEELIEPVIEVKFKGVDLLTMSFSIQFDLEPGLYELRAKSRVDDPTPMLFFVTESASE